MRARLRPLLLVSALLVLASCQGPSPRAGAPGARRPIPPEVVAARMRLRSHDLAGTLALLDAGAPLDARRRERTWLLAHVRAGAGEAPAVLGEVAALPPSPYRTALEATLAEEPRAARAALERARAQGADPWVSLAAAWAAERVGATREAWALALEARGRGVAYVDVETWLIEARVHLEEGRLERAVAAGRRAMELEPTDTRAHAVVAAAARRAGRLEDALDAWMGAVEQIPGNQGYPRAIAHLLRRFRDPALAARVAARLEPRLEASSPEHVALAGLLAERRGETARARERYVRALAAGANPVPVDRDLRRLCFQEGAYAEGLALLDDAVPRGVREDPANQLAGRWRRLAAAGRAAPDASASEAAALELARALVGVGALEECRLVCARLTAPEAKSLGRRVEGQLALEDAFEAYLEGGFRRGHRHEDPPSLERALAELGRLACEHLPPDEAAAFRPPWRGLRRVPVVGGWLDHSAATTSPIVAHFRRYGRFLMLGRREDQPTEAIVLSLASLTPARTIHTRGCVLHHDVAIGYDRRLGSWLEATGAELGGACLPDGIWIDTDSARSGEVDTRRALVLDPERTRRLREAPRLLAPDGPGGLFGLTESSGVGVRLLERYVARRSDPWGSLGTLTAHEYGHVVEIRRHLPILRGLPASLALFASRGFSPPLVESELERRAQLAAVAASADPDLALAEMVLLQPVVEGDPEVHALGYRDGLAGIVIHVWQHPDRFPQIDRDHRILPQLDLLTNDQIRACARAALGVR